MLKNHTEAFRTTAAVIVPLAVSQVTIVGDIIGSVYEARPIKGIDFRQRVVCFDELAETL